MKRRSVLVAFSSVIALAASGAAYAQEGPNNAQANPAATPGGDNALNQGAVPAKQADGSVTPDNSGIGDIVVTARRQAESAQKVPISITALSGQTLRVANVTDVQGISRVEPGIQILSAFFTGNATFQIRGQYQNDTGATVDPSVSLYFDDVYIGSSDGSLINLVDVARVEVLKGPQGTLFGKNTTGGAVQIVSNRPTHNFEGYALGSYESYDRYKLEGVINVPVSDDFAVRVVGQYIRKTGDVATNLVDNVPYNKQRDYFTRVSGLYTPTDRLSILVEGDYSHNSGGSPATTLIHYAPANDQAAALDVALETGNGFNVAAGQAILLALANSPSGSRLNGIDLRTITANSYTFNPVTGQFSTNGGTIDAGARSETYGLLANITYDFGFASLKSITAYRHQTSYTQYDVDGTQYAIVDAMESDRYRQFSQEFILNGKAFNDKLNLTVGGLYFSNRPDYTAKALAVGAIQYLFGAGPVSDEAKAKNTSYGLYAQGTYSLTDRLSVTGGVRYSHDHKELDASAFSFTPAGTSTCTFTAANGLSTVADFRAPCDLVDIYDKGEVTYTASLNYQIDPDKLIYFRTGSGFRAGGFNERITAPESRGSFEPETLTDYEVGIKADWLQHRLRTNAAVFHSKLHNDQEAFNFINAQDLALTKTVNAGTRTVDGFEFSMIARPADFLIVDGSVNYLHARVKDITTPDTFTFATPPWTATIGATVNMPFSDTINGSLRGDFSFRDKMHDGPSLRDASGAVVYVGYYAELELLSARYTLRHNPTGIELAVFGRNLTDQTYVVRQSGASGLGTTIGNLGEGRVVGVELKVPFGGR